MLSRYFRSHGHLCASRPWEVIIGTLTLIVCVMSISLFATNRKICGWNYKCRQPQDDTKSSDVIILTLTRCLAVIYVYLQFRNLRKLGSKYLLGITAICTICATFVFSIGVINIIGSDLTGLNEALPFFLLLVDLSKACTLAKFAFSAVTQDEVVENIGNGMAKLGPALTLDALVETLVIGVGTLSGVKTLETMCCFGCLSVLANYLAFMTFYPACLALVLDLTRGSRPLLQIQQLAHAWQEEEDGDEKPSPVTQRVKIIMSAGLMFVHLHGRLFAGVSDVDDGETYGAPSLDSAIESGALIDQSGLSSAQHILVPNIPLWQFYIQSLTSLSWDYFITLILALILGIKYVIFDNDESQLTDPISMEVLTNHDSGLIQAPPPMCSEPMGEQRQSDNHMGCGLQTDMLRSDRQNSSQKIFTVGDGMDDEDNEVKGVAVSVETQTDLDLLSAEGGGGGMKGEVEGGEKIEESVRVRTLDECVNILQSEAGASALTDAEILLLVKKKHVPAYKLESAVGDRTRGVTIRRSLISESLRNRSALDSLPFKNYDYKYVDGACCENVIGYVPVPVGVAGPLLLDGKLYSIPMATTEGCLVASTNRGCRALSGGDGVKSMVVRDGMTRAPLVRFASAERASIARRWLEDQDNYELIAQEFNSTSRFARLQRMQIVQVARSLHVRFVAVTGDAMGMNMLSKGSEKALKMLREHYFPDMEILSVSGNMCTDKKASAINWIEGRGKSVVTEAIVPRDVIRNTLKTSTAALVDLNINKNLIGSVAAGSIGGNNAHAANIVTAIYIATGQDPAQNICSSNCLTLMESAGPDNEDLYISCTMPSIEVGTIGGGTVLPPQSACLEMLGVRGANQDSPGANACALARVVCATVMAGELSLMSALAAGHLVQSHMKHNRSVINIAPNFAEPAMTTSLLNPIPITSSSSSSSSGSSTVGSIPSISPGSWASPGTCTANAP